MSQMDNAITAIRQFFDKCNRDEQLSEQNRNMELFQAARAFYNAITHFERSTLSKALEGKKRVRAAESIAKHAKGGRTVDVPVTYKSKKKVVPSQKLVGVVKKSGSIVIASAKEQQNRKGKKTAVTKALVTRSKNRGVKCIKCGQPFGITHVCLTTSRQQPPSEIKPPTSIKQNAREKDETKKSRRTTFDKSVSGTPIGATKHAGATGKVGKRSGTIHATRFNARFKKGRS